MSHDHTGALRNGRISSVEAGSRNLVALASVWARRGNSAWTKAVASSWSSCGRSQIKTDCASAFILHILARRTWDLRRDKLKTSWLVGRRRRFFSSASGRRHAWTKRLDPGGARGVNDEVTPSECGVFRKETGTYLSRRLPRFNVWNRFGVAYRWSPPGGGNAKIGRGAKGDGLLICAMNRRGRRGRATPCGKNYHFGPLGWEGLSQVLNHPRIGFDDRLLGSQVMEQELTRVGNVRLLVWASSVSTRFFQALTASRTPGTRAGHRR